MKNNLTEKIFKKKVFLTFLVVFFVFVFSIIYREDINKSFKSIGNFLSNLKIERVMGYGYEEEPVPEDPDPEPEPESEKPPEWPNTNGNEEESLIVEYQAYCYSQREGQILFSWSGLNSSLPYVFQLYKYIGEEYVLVLERDGIASNFTLISVIENPSYETGVVEDGIGFNGNYFARVKNEGLDNWIYYIEEADSTCENITNMTYPALFEENGDCNPDGFNIDSNVNTFTTATHFFPHLDYSINPEAMEKEIEIEFNFIGECYNDNCVYYKWNFEEGDPSLVEASSATTTFSQDGRYDVTLTVEDGDDYGCISLIKRRVGSMFPMKWREIVPWTEEE